MADEESPWAGLQETIGTLADLKGELDTYDAQLGELVPYLEALLDHLRLGVAISLKYGEHEDGTCSYFSFKKLGKRWRLCIETGRLTDPDETWLSVPLSDLPRDERAVCIEAFPRFLKAAVDAMKARVEDRQRVISSTRNLVQTVGNFLAEQTRVQGTHRYAGSSAEEQDATADPHAALGVFGDNHPGMESTQPSDVLAALARKRGKQATLGVPRRKP